MARLFKRLGMKLMYPIITTVIFIKSTLTNCSKEKTKTQQNTKYYPLK